MRNLAQVSPHQPTHPRRRSINLTHLRDLATHSATSRLPRAVRQEIEVVARVLPFRASNFVMEELIDWLMRPTIPTSVWCFRCGRCSSRTFQTHGNRLAGQLPADIKAVATRHSGRTQPPSRRPDGPERPGHGRAMLPACSTSIPRRCSSFPTQGQTCHAYCSFCFRWAQFVGDGNLRIAEREAAAAGRVSASHPGGDRRALHRRRSAGDEDPDPGQLYRRGAGQATWRT